MFPIQDTEYFFERPDYHILVMYRYKENKWYWRVLFSSEVVGPFSTFIKCARSIIKAGY